MSHRENVPMSVTAKRGTGPRTKKQTRRLRDRVAADLLADFEGVAEWETPDPELCALVAARRQIVVADTGGVFLRPRQPVSATRTEAEAA